MIQPQDLNEWSIKDFQSLPGRGWNEEIEPFDSIVILPTEDIHTSGYACMDFVAINGNTPICRLSGCSDVIHLNGIGGFGENWAEEYGTVPTKIPPIAWSVDCLSKSKLLRIFTGSSKLKAGAALSSFELFINRKDFRKDFEKWFDKNYASIPLWDYLRHEKDRLPEIMWGIYVNFFDETGIYLTIDPDYLERLEFWVDIEGKNIGGHKELGPFKTRSEARKSALETAINLYEQ